MHVIDGFLGHLWSARYVTPGQWGQPGSTEDKFDYTRVRSQGRIVMCGWYKKPQFWGQSGDLGLGCPRPRACGGIGDVLSWLTSVTPLGQIV